MSDTMTWAVLTDIHGNLPALDAVIADAQAQGADRFLNLGDILSGPLWPVETAERLMALDWPTIAGNHERQVLTQAPSRMGASDRFAAERLTDAQRRWLSSLPATMRPHEAMWCVHGTPDSDLHYLLETVTADYGVNGSKGVRAATPEEVLPRLGEPASRGTATLLLCGHTHMPRHLTIGALQLANPGSVGLPAYDWDQPHVHDMETGTPHARYALVSFSLAGWTVDLRRVDYDHEAAAQRAEANNRPDWCDALRSGRMARRYRES